jgi:hypothetical protein
LIVKRVKKKYRTSWFLFSHGKNKKISTPFYLTLEKGVSSSDYDNLHMFQSWKLICSCFTRGIIEQLVSIVI